MKKLVVCVVGMCLASSATAEMNPACRVGSVAAYPEFAEIWSISINGKTTRPETIKSARTDGAKILTQVKDYRTIDTFIKYMEAGSNIKMEWHPNLGSYIGYQVLNGDGRGLYGINTFLVHQRSDKKSLDVCLYYNIVELYIPRP